MYTNHSLPSDKKEIINLPINIIIPWTLDHKNVYGNVITDAAAKISLREE